MSATRRMGVTPSKPTVMDFDSGDVLINASEQARLAIRAPEFLRFTKRLKINASGVKTPDDKLRLMAAKELRERGIRTLSG